MENIYQQQWYNSLKKSSLTPPNKAFGIVWPILYIMMAISATLVWKACGGFCRPLLFFAIGLVFNLMWTPVFFRQRKIGLALAIILLTLGFTLYTMYLFYPISELAVWLLVPYALWLTFATYLNWYIYQNN